MTNNDPKSKMLKLLGPNGEINMHLIHHNAPEYQPRPPLDLEFSKLYRNHEKEIMDWVK